MKTNQSKIYCGEFQSDFSDNKSDEFPISIKVEVWARKIR